MGTDSPSGDWLDPLNWDTPTAADDWRLWAFIANGNTARLSAGQSAQVREIYVGTNNAGTSTAGGGLVIEDATLTLRGMRVSNNGTVLLDNATLLAHPGQGHDPYINVEHGDGAELTIVDSTLDLLSIYLGQGSSATQLSTATGTVSGSQLTLDSMRVGYSNAVVAWTQATTDLTTTSSIDIGTYLSGNGTFNLVSGTVAAGQTELGYVSNGDPIYDGLGTINQSAETVWSTGSLNLTANGTYNLNGGTLNVANALYGEGTIDFADTAATIVIGNDAELDLRHLTFLNAGQASFSASSGVLQVSAGWDDSIFGAFSFNGLVLVEGQTTTISQGETVTVSGKITSDLIIDGTLYSSLGPAQTMLAGNLTIRGEVDVDRVENLGTGIVVDGTTAVLEAGGVLRPGSLFIGDSAADATFRHEGGELIDGKVHLRSFDGGQSVYHMEGGTARMSLLAAADGVSGGQSLFNHTGGEVTLSFLGLGFTSSSGGFTHLNNPAVYGDGEGVYYLGAGAALKLNNDGNIGADSDGRFINDGGTFDGEGQRLILGRFGGNGATGTFEMRSGSVLVGRVDLGYLSTGRITQTGGVFDISGSLRIGETKGSPEVEIDPDTGLPVVVYSGGGEGYYHMIAGTLNVSSVVVSERGNGVMRQDGGVVNAGSVTVGYNTGVGVEALYELNGGTLNANSLNVTRSLHPDGITGTRGRFVQAGGHASLGRTTVAINGVYDLQGGTVDILTTFYLYKGTLDLGEGDAVVNVMEGGFLNLADGSILGGANATLTAGADTLVSLPEGFDINQIGSFTTQGLIHVGGELLDIPEYASVGGSGALLGGISNNGTLSPGNSPGTLTVLGDYTQNENAQLVIEVGANSEGGSDLLKVSDAAALDGHLSILLYNGYLPEDDAAPIEILSASSITGTFQNVVDERVYAPGGSFAIESALNDGTGKYEVLLSDFQATVVGDLNLDGFVGVEDLEVLLAHWGDTVFRGEFMAGDWTGDGFVDRDDLDIVLANWGSSTPPSTVVPEPGTVVMVLASWGLLGRRRRRAA